MIARRLTTCVLVFFACGCDDPPEGRFGCSTDEDCPDEWICRTDPSESSLRCWSTPGDGADAGPRDAGDVPMDAGRDAGMGMDAGTDASQELDGGADAGSDGGSDAGGPCDPNPCLNGGTCTVTAENAASCGCTTGFYGDLCELIDGDDCLITDHKFHSRTGPGISESFPGSHSFTAVLSGAGHVRELYVGIGSATDALAYTVTLAVGSERVVRYPSLAFDARVDRGSDTENPLFDTARAVLPEPFAVLDGDSLTITLEGAGGEMHRFADGALRAAVVGDSLPCGLEGCADGVGTHTCDGVADPCGIDLCLSGGTCEQTGGVPTCDCPAGWLGSYCAEVDDCASVTCATGFTCSDDRDAFVCSCPGCTDGNGCVLRNDLYYRRSNDASSLGFPGSHSFDVMVSMTGLIHRVHLGLGEFNSATTYSLTLATDSTSMTYPSLVFPPHNLHPYDATNTDPFHNMSEIVLPTYFPVTAGERLTVTVTGSGGTMHRFSDGTLRMTLVGSPPSCPSGYACVDGPREYTCRAL